MRKQDIKPGVVYAYQPYGQHPVDPHVPVVFLSYHPWDRVALAASTASDGIPGTIVPGRRKREQATSGTVYNDGAIGYPAVSIWPEEYTGQDLRPLLLTVMTDFVAARQTYNEQRGIRFLVVTSMVRVVGPWDAALLGAKTGQEG